MTARRPTEISMAAGPAARSGKKGPSPRLPYEDLSRLEKEAAEEALRVAWTKVPNSALRHAISLMDADEEPITRLLRDEVDKLRTDETQPVPGFSEETFQHIPEGENTPDKSGQPFKNRQRKPDLVFRPVYLPRALKGRVPSSRYGLFVECKIIHRSTDHRGIADYCSDGLMRFVDGRYASTMPSGMMVAYVRTGDDVPGCLTPHLRVDEHLKAYEVKALPALCPLRKSAKPPVYVSKHGRSTVDVDGCSPGDVEIVHLWLSVA